MKSKSPRPFIGVSLALALVLGASGCGRHGSLFSPVPNQRPTVTLAASAIATADTTWYAYDIRWQGSDPDGSVERFEYAIDPPAGLAADTVWISTTRCRDRFFFRGTWEYGSRAHGGHSPLYHTFAIRSVDGVGEYSAVASLAFFRNTIAPTVRIVRPAPNRFISQLVPPDVHIVWTGFDEDGVASQRPVQYKYRLFRVGDTEYDFQKALLYPDSLRAFYAARNFAGWDSVGGDTTDVQYTQLTLNSPYLFAVIAIDETGAYSPDFSLDSNMLKFTPAFAGTLGPIFTVFNEFFFYQYQSGGISTDPLVWINLDVPAGQPIAFNWFATPRAGYTVASYRWRVDGDPADEVPRTNEVTDWYHWSRKDPLTKSCAIGPFPGGEEHFLYIEAQDDDALLSRAIVHFKTVTPSFDKELLIVDDTRLAPDQFNAGSAVPRTYGNTLWPAAAELDTFLYAKGGFPWRGPQGVTGDLPLSRPGVFANYSFDTLGTRLGFAVPSAGVPLSVLGRYRYVLWLTDVTGAVTTYGPEALIDPISTLRWMSAHGRESMLAAYSSAGGKVWLAGGTGLTCATLPYNATGSRNNDNIYGPGHQIFSATTGELVPGRMAWDVAHWRSEFAASRPVTLPMRSTAAVGGWTNPGWKFAGTLTAPDYSRLPASMRRRALALGDSLPPTRAGFSASYYSTAVNPAVEYLTQDNFIVEDVDISPLVEDRRAVLDTLFELQGGNLATLYTGNRPVTMTYYHGVEAPEFVMTGFDLWTWSRRDVQALVEVVLENIWGMNRVVPEPGGLPSGDPGTGLPGRLPRPR